MKIFFFYESNILGGVEKLFTDLCKELNRAGFEAYILETRVQGSIYPKLIDTEYIANSFNSVKEADVVITPLSSAYKVLNASKVSSFDFTLLLWSLQPTNCIALTPGVLRLTKQGFWFAKFVNKCILNSFLANKKLIVNAYKANSIFTMDGANSEAINYFYDLSYDFPTIPLYQNKAGDQSIKYSGKKSIECRKLLWVGRFDPFKMIPLKEFILKNPTMEYTLIGGINQLDIPRSIKVTYIEKMSPKSLDEFILSSNFDLGIGMGLSALNLANAGLPVIILNPAYSTAQVSSWTWLYETKKNNLGSFSFSKDKPEMQTLPKGICLAAILDKQKSFLLNNFNEEITISTLVNAVKIADLKVSKISSLLNFNFYSRIYK